MSKTLIETGFKNKEERMGRNVERAIVWQCQKCGAYNLHLLDQEEFECIKCDYTYLAYAMAEIIEQKIEPK